MCSCWMPGGLGARPASAAIRLYGLEPVTSFSVTRVGEQDCKPLVACHFGCDTFFFF